MSVKTILAPLSDLPQTPTTLETAILVARRYGSHLVGLHVQPRARERNLETVMELASLGRSNPLVYEFSNGALQVDDAETQATRRLFEEACSAQQIRLLANPAPLNEVTADFKSVFGDGPESVAEQARVFDLVIVGQPKTDPGHSQRETLRAVLFHAGRPVLCAPERTPASIGARILISWNGSMLSARAAAIARHYFVGSQKVGVLSVQNGNDRGPSAGQLVEHLAWHGNEAALIEVELGRRRLGEAILEEAEDFNADLLVMGAYSQSPFRESLTRGITNHILSHAELPVLMTH